MSGLGVWIVAALLAAFALVLASRFLHRDSRVKSTRFGFYVERERYSDEEIYNFDPLDPGSVTRPAPPPPPPTHPPSVWEPGEERHESQMSLQTAPYVTVR